MLPKPSFALPSTTFPLSRPASAKAAAEEKELARALEALERGDRSLADSANERLPAHIIRILPEAEQTAQSKVPEMQARLAAISEQLNELLDLALAPGRSRKARLEKLREAASIFSQALEPLSACVRQACAHCCHIPVAVCETEAELIAEAVGRKPRRVPAKRHLSQEYGYHRPCPFLKAGRCSIYAARPLACRVHLSLDSSDRLCVLVQGVDVPVPLADARQLQALYVEASGGEPLADIRDFFG